ncbi:50S ribosomal protein L19 [bacterium]|nr:50S ribosomal protein L19 [bacterium]
MSAFDLQITKLRTDIPEFGTGDEIIVRSKIKEGAKERIQAFEGLVIKRKGSGIQETFTVRKIASGVGVERIFTLHSPALVDIERKKEGFVRRSKLYYMRDRKGKAARIQDKNLRLMEAKGAKKKSGNK